MDMINLTFASGGYLEFSRELSNLRNASGLEYADMTIAGAIKMGETVTQRRTIAKDYPLF